MSSDLTNSVEMHDLIKRFAPNDEPDSMRADIEAALKA